MLAHGNRLIYHLIIIILISDHPHHPYQRLPASYLPDCAYYIQIGRSIELIARLALSFGAPWTGHCESFEPDHIAHLKKIYQPGGRLDTEAGNPDKIWGS